MKLEGMSSLESIDLPSLTDTYLQEAEEAKKDRMEMNKINFDCYHFKQDYSHKKDGQSREFLPKQAMAVEQITAFIQQGLMDTDDWFGVDEQPGLENPIMTPNEVKLWIEDQLNKNLFYDFVADSLKSGFLGSLMICKVHGSQVVSPRYFTEEELVGNKVKKKLLRKDQTHWQLKLDLVRQQDYYPDPTGRGMYEIQRIEMDLSQVWALTEGEDPLYEKAVVEELVSAIEMEEIYKREKARETGQNIPFAGSRKTIEILECWGDIIDPVTGKVVEKDVTWSVANRRHVIAKPKPYPFWHGRRPFVTAPVVRVPNSVWHKALMDAPTRHNVALNELYNLILDGGMMATHGIKQLRTDWLEDPSQVSSGIYPGQTLDVNASCPPGGKVLERVDTSSLSQESLSVFQMTNGEFQQSALTNDLRLGILPARAVKATEVVEASNTITSVFTGVAKQIEVAFLERILELSWLTMAQNADTFDTDDMVSLFGKERATQLQSLSAEERFENLVKGHKFKVYGVSKTLNKVKDFRKLTSLLQTIGSSEVLLEEFMKKYDFGKFLSEIMKSLDINVDRIKLDEIDTAMIAAGGGGMPMEGGPGVGSSPNAQSQIPQASAGSLTETLQSRIPQAQFPSQALSRM